MKAILRSLSALLLIPIMLWATACNQNTVAALVNTLGNAASSIAAVENNPTLAAKLKVDTAAAVSAVKNWKSGTPAQEVIQALNLVQDDLGLFPAIGPYAPLVGLAITTVESILAIVSPSAAPSVSSVSAPKTAKEFTKQWNALAKDHPEVAIK